MADLLRVYPEPTLLVSPWLTLEEGELVQAWAAGLGVDAAFVSPPPNDLADDLLHTGDPCPNRRGLTELGLSPVTAEEARERLEGAASAVLIGERIVELVGGETLAALPRTKRLVVLDTRALDVPATSVCLGVPNAVERTGTWVNVDGHRGTLDVARSAPPGVPPLTRTLEELRARTAPAEVGS